MPHDPTFPEGDDDARAPGTLLAIETAGQACAAGVFGADGLAAAESQPMARGHAEALMPMIARIRAAAPDAFGQIGRVAVGVGPGSFTGIRVGLSAARALALALDVPCVGVSSLAAFAAPEIAVRREGVVAAAVDARHGQVFVQVFGPAGRTVGSPRLATLREAARLIGAGPVRLVGSGAHLLAQEVANLNIPILGIEPSLAPDIAWVARLGAAADPAQAAPRPLYLKEADARAPVRPPVRTPPAVRPAAAGARA